MALISAFPSGPFQTNAYIVACPQTRSALIIDPSHGSLDSIISFCKQHELKPEKIVLTHSHWDHFGDAAATKAHYHIPLYIHAADAENLKTPGSDGVPFFGSVPPVQSDGFLNEGDIVTAGTLNFKVIHTPGHTPGGICLYEPEAGILLSGDTLFKGSIGSLSLATSDAEKMWESLPKLAALPGKTKVYPGHGPSTTIEAQTWLSNARELFETT